MINQVYFKKWLWERGQQINLKCVFTLKNEHVNYMTKEYKERNNWSLKIITYIMNDKYILYFLTKNNS